jgi:sulfonate transport system permease protein
VSALGLLVAWHVASALAGTNGSHESMVPNVVDLGRAFEHLADYWRGGFGVEATSVSGHGTWQGAVLGLLYNTGLTTLHAMGGVALGIATGLLLAVAVSWSSVLRGMFATPGHFARMLPLLAMAPLFALWFGNTGKEAILFTGFVAFSLVFPIAVNAIGNVPSYYGQYAASLGASRRQAYGAVVIPAALPELRSGIMLAVGFGWSAAIAAEYIGHDFGLGHIVQSAEYFGRTGVLALVALISLLLAAGSFAAVGRLLAWATRWAE